MLVIISVSQAFQLNGIKNAIGTQEVSLTTSSSSVSSTPTSDRQESSLPSSLQNLPEMVGGC